MAPVVLPGPGSDISEEARFDLARAHDHEH